MTTAALVAGVAGAETAKGQEWKEGIFKIMDPAGYRCVGERQLVGLLCAVYVHNRHKPHVSNCVVKAVGCGLGGFAGNKGGIAVSFHAYETKLSFVNSHLAAHMAHVSQRNEDFESVAEALLRGEVGPARTEAEQAACAAEKHGLEGKSPMLIEATSPVVWFGDLNYRIPLDFDTVRSSIAIAHAHALSLRRLGRCSAHS